MKQVLMNIAKSDLKTAKQNGSMAISDTKKGTLFIEYKNRYYTIHDNKGWAYYVGALKGAVEFVASNYVTA